MIKKRFLLVGLALTLVSSNININEDDLNMVENYSPTKANDLNSENYANTRMALSDYLLDNEVTLDEEDEQATCITVLTHCMGGHFYDWSKNQAFGWDGTVSTDGNNFTYDLEYNPDSIISLIKKKVDGAILSGTTNLDIVVASYKFDLVDAEEGTKKRVYTDKYDIRLYDDNEIIFSHYDFKTVNGKTKLVEDKLKRSNKIENVDKHLLVIYDSINPRQGLDSEYRDYKRVLDSVLYDVKHLTGDCPEMNLIGYSNGGLLCTRYATDHPYNVSAVKTIGTPYNGTTFITFLRQFIETYDNQIKPIIESMNEGKEPKDRIDYEKLKEDTIFSDVFGSIENPTRIRNMRNAWNDMINKTSDKHHINATAYGSVLTFGYLDVLIEQLFGVLPENDLTDILEEYDSDEEKGMDMLMKYYVKEIKDKFYSYSFLEKGSIINNKQLYFKDNNGFKYSSNDALYDILSDTYDEIESDATAETIAKFALAIFSPLTAIFTHDEIGGGMALSNCQGIDIKGIIDYAKNFLCENTKVAENVPSTLLSMDCSVPTLYGDVCVDLDSQMATGYNGFTRKYKFYTGDDLKKSSFNAQDTTMPPVPHNLEPYDQTILPDVIGDLHFSNQVKLIPMDISKVETINLNNNSCYSTKLICNNLVETIKTFTVTSYGNYVFQTLGNTDTRMSLLEHKRNGFGTIISPIEDDLNKGYLGKNEFFTASLKPNTIYQLRVWNKTAQSSDVGILVYRTQDDYKAFDELPFASINPVSDHDTFVAKFIPAIDSDVTFDTSESYGLSANIKIIDTSTGSEVSAASINKTNNKVISRFNLSHSKTYLIYAWKESFESSTIKINIRYGFSSNTNVTNLTFTDGTYKQFSDSIPQNGIVDHYFKVNTWGWKYFIAFSDIDIRMQLYEVNDNGEYIYLSDHGDDVDNAFNGEAQSADLYPNKTYLLRIFAYDSSLSGTVKTLILPVCIDYWCTDELPSLQTSSSATRLTEYNAYTAVYTPSYGTVGARIKAKFDLSASSISGSHLNVFDTETGNLLTPDSSTTVDGKDIKTYTMTNGKKYLVHFNKPDVDGASFSLKITNEAIPVTNVMTSRMYETTSTLSAGDVKDYYLTFNVSGIKLFQTFSSKDTYMYLYDENDNLLTSNDDGGYSNYCSLFSYPVTAGKTYKLRVRFYSLTTSGSIRTTITPINTTYTNYDGLIQAKVGMNSVYVSQNTCLPMTFKSSTASTYTFTTGYSGSYIDTYLYIVDPSTGTVYCNDDSAGNCQAKITLSLEANKAYYVVLCGYNPTSTNGYGAMTLNITK